MADQGEAVQQAAGAAANVAPQVLDAAAIQALIDQAVQAALQQQQANQQQQQANPVAPPAPVQQPAFALVPGDGHANRPWDFTTGDGLKLFQAATKPLETKYNGSVDKLQYFLDAIQNRAETYGMAGVLRVNVAAAGAPDDHRSLTVEYGAITAIQMQTHAQTYQALDNRARQSAAVLLTLLKQSIAPETLDELKQKDFKVTVNVGGVHVQREDGPMMLFKLIDMVAVETKATINSISKTLTGAGMAQIMVEVKSNIKEFNNKVNMLMVALRARRKQVPDITPHLFEAYQTCEDNKFVEYIADHEAQFEDGRVATISNASLMTLALQKYKTLVDKDMWLQKSKKELEFIAMISKLQADNKKLVPKTKKTTPSKAKGKGTKTGPVNDGDWAWKGIAPVGSEPTERTFRGKKYIYCDHGDTKWVLEERRGVKHIHSCSKLKADSDTASTSDSSSGSEATPKKQQAWTKALAAVQEDVSTVTEPQGEDEEL